MTESATKTEANGGGRRTSRASGGCKISRRRLTGVAIALTVLGAGLVCVATVGATASSIKSELDAAIRLVPALKDDLAASRSSEAAASVEKLRAHTTAAKKSAENPIWTLASSVPGFGQNFTAVSEVARSADDVANLGLAPLVSVFTTLDWNSLLPNDSGTSLGPFQEASPSVSSAAHAVRLSAARLDGIDATKLLPQIAAPLTQAREQLKDVSKTLDSAADAAALAPQMMGSQGPRNYLLMIQNNAEVRATGGIPGALAVLSLDNGKLTLGTQSSAGDLGVISPVIPVDSEQHQIYSGRLGKFMQDVNLTPDFPTAASTARSMWERKTGQRVDGVISIDPIALSYILEATGPVTLSNPQLTRIASSQLPLELTGRNVVQTLLSDVYSKIEEPYVQDIYFAGVAQEVFKALSEGRGNATALIAGIARAVDEGRVLVWSSQPSEQQLLANYPLGGGVAGPGIAPAQFGVYFNDGTGAKMDYYVKRTAQLLKECPRDGYEQTTVRVTSINTAPADAATSLPAYVTGDGVFGVPPGSVQTNIVAYGPVQAHIEMVEMDGQKTEFAPHLHSSRPVGVIAIRLAPGESKTVDFTFGKIVQHTEPNLFVTPTVQDVKEVTKPTENVGCN